MKILISGGGIAGCTLAYFLRQVGVAPVIVEAAPQFGRAGYLLALNEQIGQKVAQKMGILDRLKSVEVPLTKNTLYDVSGKLISQYELDHKTHNQRVGLMLNRADLHLALYDAISEGVEIRMGQAIASLTQTESGVTVTLDNGQRETFDLVIGADGVHSNVRRLVFGEGFEKLMGQAYFAFVAPNRTTKQVAQKNEAVVVRGDGFAIAYHALGTAEIGGYVFHEERIPERLAPKERRAFVLQTYGRHDGNFRHMLETMTDEDAIFHDGFTQIIMPVWHRQRVCLIGDAASCPTPASGLGASMAMAAGYILAKKLSEAADYQKAFSDYDAHMRPYTRKAQASAASMGKLSVSGRIISYEFTNLILRLLPSEVLARFHSHAIAMPLP